jgi:LPXTG-site transpeptidase (sortase) family protein
LISGCSSTKIIETNLDYINTSNLTYYGYLDIPKINMHLGFYNYDNPLNNVNKNIELIKSNIKDTYIIAGHSGTGKVSFFNDLKFLAIDDIIYLSIDNNTSTYKVIDINNTKKNGTISIPNTSNLLILTTCNQILKGYQLTITAKIIANDT